MRGGNVATSALGCLSGVVWRPGERVHELDRFDRLQAPLEIKQLQHLRERRLNLTALHAPEVSAQCQPHYRHGLRDSRLIARQVRLAGEAGRGRRRGEDPLDPAAEAAIP